MKNTHSLHAVGWAIVLALGSACGSNPPSSEQTSALKSDGSSGSACCRDAFPPGDQRRNCYVEARQGLGICGGVSPPDAGTCQELGNACDGSVPCCSGLVCSNGVCLEPQPACMPDGALCSSVSRCCSNQSCKDGFCGGACIIDGVACDPAHVCCSTGLSCNEGVCGGVACLPLGQFCGNGSDLQCCGRTFCLFGRCATQPACASLGDACNVTLAGCCSGMTCGPNGTCVITVGCSPPGQDCLAGTNPPCCSGVCVPGAPRGQCL